MIVDENFLSEAAGGRIADTHQTYHGSDHDPVVQADKSDDSCPYPDAQHDQNQRECHERAADGEDLPSSVDIGRDFDFFGGRHVDRRRCERTLRQYWLRTKLGG